VLSALLMAVATDATRFESVQRMIADFLAHRGDAALREAPNAKVAGEVAMALIRCDDAEADLEAMNLVKPFTRDPNVAAPTATSDAKPLKAASLAMLRLMRKPDRWPGTWVDAIEMAVGLRDERLLDEAFSSALPHAIAAELRLPRRDPKVQVQTRHRLVSIISLDALDSRSAARAGGKGDPADDMQPLREVLRGYLASNVLYDLGRS
jgi:hypothetical protein